MKNVIFYPAANPIIVAIVNLIFFKYSVFKWCIRQINLYGPSRIV